MNDPIDSVDLAGELASIASATNDPATAQHLMEIVEHLLVEAGLPSSDDCDREVPTSRGVPPLQTYR